MSKTPRPRLLHVHSTFDLGGKEARAVQLMNAWGDRYEHIVVSAEPAALAARELLERGVLATFPAEPPPLSGRWSPRRIAAIGRWMEALRPDLVLSYNWGAMDAVMANRLRGRAPLVHHEDGFDSDEAERQRPARILYRRLALPVAQRLVVPSRNLERIALGPWRQPPARVACVPNGVDLALYDRPPAPDAIPGLERRPGEVLVGTLAGLRTVKNLPRLVRAFAAARQRCPEVEARLVIVGRGPDEARIRQTAASHGVADRLVMPGFLPHPHRYLRLFDLFALSSDSEQFPISLVEAMAAGLPAVSTAVGDVPEILAEPNRAYLSAPADAGRLGENLAAVLADPALRARLGAANRARVGAEFSLERMIARYAELYEAALRSAGRAVAR